MSGSKPPLPRGRDQISFSELVPFRSRNIRLWRSPLVWLAGFTVVFAVLLFVYRMKVLNAKTLEDGLASFDVVTEATIFYILALSLIGVHAYSKTDKPIYYHVLPILFVLLFMKFAFFGPYYNFFEMISGGHAAETSPDLLRRMWWGFTSPGLREELAKGLPILFGAALMVWADKFSSLPPRLTQLLRVRTPLDGVLMGFGCGCAFIFFETGGQYLHNAFMEYYNATKNFDGAVGSALLLLIPRTMDGWAGHIGYSGIFGYFIGLAVIRRAVAPQLILGGWAVAALLHGLWDSGLPGDDKALYAVGAATALLAMGCFLKARQLEASLFGRGSASSGSIIVPAGYMPAPALPQSPAAPAAFAAPAFAPPASAPAPFAPFAPAAAPVPVPAVAGLQRPAALALALPSRTLTLVVGQTLEIDEPGLSMSSQGIKAEVTQHPTNAAITGLKNVGLGTWYARLRDGTIQPIEAQRSLRLAEGVGIDFGSGLVGKIVTA